MELGRQRPRQGGTGQTDALQVVLGRSTHQTVKANVDSYSATQPRQRDEAETGKAEVCDTQKAGR